MSGGPITVVDQGSGRLPASELAESRWRLFCAAAVGVLTLLVSAPALNDYRVADSFRLVGQIDFPAALRYLAETTGFGRSEYRPLVQFSYAWDHLLWGDRAFGYHLTNILLHTANSILLFLVFGRLTGNLVLGFVAAAFFSVHPIHHSRIAWIAARDGTLSMFFLLLSWLAYLSSNRQASDSEARPSRWPRFAYPVISCILYLLALLSYEGAVVFPLMVIAQVLLFAPPAERWPERVRSALGAAAPYLLLSGLYVAWWLLLFQGKLGAYDLDWSLGGVARDFYRLHYRLFYHIQHWLGILYLVILILVWRLRRQQWKQIGFALLLIWIGYLPFLPIRGFSDRFAYCSSIGAAFLLSLCVSETLGTAGKLRSRSAFLPVVLVLVLIGYYTHSIHRRIQFWTDSGRIAETIPAQLKALRASFPPDATLVFEQIPLRHGDAHLFPNSFRVAVRQKYRNPPERIFYYPTVMEPAQQKELLQGPPAFRFRYLPDREKLVEIRGPSGESSRRR